MLLLVTLWILGNTVQYVDAVNTKTDPRNQQYYEIMKEVKETECFMLLPCDTFVVANKRPRSNHVFVYNVIFFFHN